MRETLHLFFKLKMIATSQVALSVKKHDLSMLTTMPNIMATKRKHRKRQVTCLKVSENSSVLSDIANSGLMDGEITARQKSCRYRYSNLVYR